MDSWRACNQFGGVVSADAFGHTSTIRVPDDALAAGCQPRDCVAQIGTSEVEAETEEDWLQACDTGGAERNAAADEGEGDPSQWA